MGARRHIVELTPMEEIGIKSALNDERTHIMVWLPGLPLAEFDDEVYCGCQLTPEQCKEFIFHLMRWVVILEGSAEE